MKLLIIISALPFVLLAVSLISTQNKHLCDDNVYTCSVSGCCVMFVLTSKYLFNHLVLTASKLSFVWGCEKLNILFM